MTVYAKVKLLHGNHAGRTVYIEAVTYHENREWWIDDDPHMEWSDTGDELTLEECSEALYEKPRYPGGPVDEVTVYDYVMDKAAWEDLA